MMKTLVKNLQPWYCSEVVEQNIIGGDIIKFKIECRNGGGNRI